MSSEGSDDRQPSLRGHHPTSSQHERFREERQCTNKIFTQYQVTEPQFRFIPLLGCSIILLNDAEFFFKQVATFRAIEAMYCIEYYQSNDPSIAALGRAIPERLCKADSIEKQVATTYGLIMFFRLLPCIFTAVPLGYLADKAGRRPVLILHKIGTIVFVSMEIIVCKLRPDHSSRQDCCTLKYRLKISYTLRSLFGFCTSAGLVLW
jgi:MFS family permease